MVKAEELFDGTNTEGLVYNDAMRHYWRCFVCENDTFSGQVDVCDIEGYERKHLVRCGECGFTDLVHFWYRGQKRMNDLVLGDEGDPERYKLTLDFYWTGKHVVKTMIEEGPVATTFHREPRSHHPAYSEPDHNLPQLVPTLEDVEMEDHDDNSEMAVPHDAERAGVDTADVDT